MQFLPQRPRAEAFQALRNSAGWGDISLKTAKAALDNSLGTACLYDGDTLVACARYVGDGVLNIYIQDVVVKKLYRGKGLGKMLMQQIIFELQQHYPSDCTIGLMAAKEQDAFYMQFGFKTRPSDVYGAGMIASLGGLRGLDAKR